MRPLLDSAGSGWRALIFWRHQAKDSRFKLLNFLKNFRDFILNYVFHGTGESYDRVRIRFHKFDVSVIQKKSAVVQSVQFNHLP